MGHVLQQVQLHGRDTFRLVRGQGQRQMLNEDFTEVDNGFFIYTKLQRDLKVGAGGNLKECDQIKIIIRMY